MPDPYVKQTWIDGVAGATPISAARLTYIEDGIENATVEDGTYAPFLETIQALGNMGAAATIGDPAEDGSLVTGTLTADCAITLPTPVAGQSFTLLLTQDGTGGWTATWAGGTVAWPNGVAPVLTTTAAKTDMLVFVAADSSKWRASLVAAAYA